MAGAPQDHGEPAAGGGGGATATGGGSAGGPRAGAGTLGSGGRGADADPAVEGSGGGGGGAGGLFGGGGGAAGTAEIDPGSGAGGGASFGPANTTIKPPANFEITPAPGRVTFTYAVAGPPATLDRSAPSVVLTRPRANQAIRRFSGRGKARKRRALVLSGRATDPSGVRSVVLSIERLPRAGRTRAGVARCAWVTASSRLRSGSCDAPRALTATLAAGGSWSYRIRSATACRRGAIACSSRARTARTSPATRRRPPHAASGSGSRSRLTGRLSRRRTARCSARCARI